MEVKPTIFWDFDGTLAYREGMFSGALVEALDSEKQDHDIKREDFKLYLDSGFPWHNPEKPHLELSTPDKWWEVLEDIFKEAYQGVGFGTEEAIRLAELAREIYVDPEGFELYDDTKEVLETLADAGWKHIILSNHRPELSQIVSELGLDKYIVNCISSANVGYEKPHPEIFRLGLKAAGEPEDVRMVGDNLKADIEGANEVGIPAILVQNQKEKDVKYQVDDLIGTAKIINRV